MNESQVEAQKVIESLIRQIAEYAHKVAILEAMLNKTKDTEMSQIQD
jgi:hypothetical protein